MSEPEMNVVDAEKPESSDEPQPQRRDRSTIGFPYNDLDDAEQVVTAIADNGGSQGSMSALAAWMKHDTVNSGTFRNKVSAARLFGLVEVDDRIVSLTPLGHELRDPQLRDRARARAFRNVPLYDAIFAMYDGKLLPSNVGLENEIKGLGVAPKQADKARQVLARAAEQSGYFGQGHDRLTTPSILFREADHSHENDEPDAEEGNGDGGGGNANTTLVKLRSGGTITMIVDADLVALSRVKSDREFVFGLLDKLADYEQNGEQKMLAAPGAEPTTVEQETV